MKRGDKESHDLVHDTKSEISRPTRIMQVVISSRYSLSVYPCMELRTRGFGVDTSLSKIGEQVSYLTNNKDRLRLVTECVSLTQILLKFPF